MENTISQDIKNLVIARISTLPSGKKISVGSKGDFSKEEIIKHVENGDEIGNKMVQIEMSYLRALKEGILYDERLLTHNSA